MRRLSVLGAVLVLAIVWWVPAAASRNWVSWQWLRRGVPASVPSASSPMLALRVALAHGDWAAVGPALQALPDADRLGPLLVINAAEQRATAGEAAAARTLAAAVFADTRYDAEIWYRLGAVAERAGDEGMALAAYDRGAARDASAPWTEGAHRAALVAERQRDWTRVVVRLAPLLVMATDRDLGRPIQTLQPGGAIWQGSFLALGEAREQLGQWSEAEAVYARLAAITTPRRDWTWNRTLVGLARVRLRRGAATEALAPIAAALDTASHLDPEVRPRFERDTADTAIRVLDAIRPGDLSGATAGLPDDAGAWFLRGYAAERVCDWAAARAAYATAAARAGRGAAAYLEGRPVVGGCPR